MTRSSNEILSHLCSMPGTAFTVLTTRDLRDLLVDTSGEIILRGRIFEITSRKIGPGVYRVSLKLKPMPNAAQEAQP